MPEAGPLVEVARKASAGRPDTPAALRALGAALYRAGKYEEAAKHPTDLPAKPGDRDPAGLLFLAMARQRLGKPEAARDLRDRAGREAAPPDWAGRAEVDLLRREADSVLGPLPKPKEKDK